jgi:hypothetical protein
MKPSFWSLKGNMKEDRAWYNSGHNIKYEASQYRDDINELNTLSPKKNYMQLQFDFSFEEPNDEVLCCYTVPYSYSEMTVHLQELKAISYQQNINFLRIETIG